MVKFKTKKRGNKFQKLVSGIHDLNKEFVQVGHFEESGTHHSGYTYPQLMAIHHNPEANGFDWPRRPVLDVLFHLSKDLTLVPGIKAAILRYASTTPSPTSNKRLLDDIGKHLAQQEKDIFGSSLLAPNSPITILIKGRNDPMIDTGDLKEKTSYKTSKEKVVKGV